MKIVHTIVVICHQIVFHFQQQNKSNWSDIWSQANMSGFLQNNVRDPRSLDLDFLELWVSQKMTDDNDNTISRVCKF